MTTVISQTDLVISLNDEKVLWGNLVAAANNPQIIWHKETIDSTIPTYSGKSNKIEEEITIDAYVDWFDSLKISSGFIGTFNSETITERSLYVWLYGYNIPVGSKIEYQGQYFKVDNSSYDDRSGKLELTCSYL